MIRMSRSASRSGAKRSALVLTRSNNHPMWACQNPLANATGPVPYNQGECCERARWVKYR